MQKNLPVLTTKRLILREIEDKDCYDMYEYACLSFIGPSAGWEPHESLSHTKNIIKLFKGKIDYGQLGVFAIVLQESNKMIGTIELHSYIKGFKAELGYTINPRYWGKGYAIEAAKVIIAWGFDYLELRRIECIMFCNNHQSVRVCEKLGLTFEGKRKKGYMLYDGTVNDVLCYSIVDEEFYERIRDHTWDKE
ncbi:MAG: GNAT family protein [Bacilli bacterium]|jgi:RimJ/RimL family protein N-acetyltransferase|nr:GNAT family protein [Bacilli bacterium]